MMRLVCYELKKIFKFQNMLLLIVVFSLLNLVFVHYGESSKYTDPVLYGDIYEKILNDLDQYDEKTANIELNRLIAENRIVSDLNEYVPGSKEYDYLLLEYQKTNPELLDRALNGLIDINLENLEVQKQALGDIKKEKENVEYYDDSINSIISQSESMAGISIFAGSELSLKNIDKTANDYKKIEGVRVTFSNHLAIKSFLTEKYTYIFALVLCMISVFSLTVNEQNSGMSSLIETTINGRRKTIQAKYYALLIFTAIILAFLYFLNGIYFQLIYGFKNVFDPIQSIYGFADFTIPISCFETIVLFYGTRLLSVFALVSVIFTLVYIFGGSVITGFVFVAFLVVEAILLYLVPANSFVDILKYYNIFHIFDCDYSVFQYHNVFLINKVYSLKYVIVALSLAFCIISFAIIVFGKKMKVERNISINLKLPNLTSHTSLYFHELYKSLVHNGGLIIIVIFFAFLFGKMDDYKYTFKNTNIEYMTQIYGGEITDEKEDEIKILIEQVEKAECDLSKLDYELNEGLINISEYYEKSVELKSISSKKVALEQLEETIARNKSIQNGGIVFDTGFERLFNYNLDNSRLNPAMIEFFVIVSVLICCIVPIVVTDNVSEADYLYKLTINNNKRMLAKQLVGFTYTFVILFCYSVWKYIAVSKYLSLYYGGLSIASVPSLQNMFSGNISLNNAYILSCIIRLGVLLSIMEIMFLISKKSTSVLMAVLLSVLIIVLPNMLVIFGISNIKLLPVNFFVSTGVFAMDLIFIVYIFVTIFIGVLCFITYIKLQ